MALTQGGDGGGTLCVAHWASSCGRGKGGALSVTLLRQSLTVCHRATLAG